MAHATIARDPFAREELHRETVHTSDTCDWCGGTRRSGTLFQYSIERDGVYSWRTRNIPGLFCSVSCMRTYHEIEG